jgi:hypothetical protein
MSANLVPNTTAAESGSDSANAAGIGSSSPAAYAITALHDYMYRSDLLEELSWFEFVSLYERVRKSKARAEIPGASSAKYRRQLSFQSIAAELEENPDERLFWDEHPLAKTHCLQKREIPATPIIYGDRLPDVRGLDSSDADIDAQNTYGRRAFLLFCPFRLADLEDSQNSADAQSSGEFEAPVDLQNNAWQLWLEKGAHLLAPGPGPAAGFASTAGLDLRRIIQNMQCYWLGAERKDAARANGLTQQDIAQDEDGAEEAPHDHNEDALDFQDRVEEAATAADDRAAIESNMIHSLQQCGALDSLPNATHGSEARVFGPSVTRQSQAALKKKLTQGRRAAEENLAAASAAVTAGPADPERSAEQTHQSARADWIQGSISAMADSPISESTAESVAAIQHATGAVKVQAALALLHHVIQHPDYTLNKKQSQVFLLVGKQFLASCFQVTFDGATDGPAATAQVKDLHSYNLKNLQANQLLAYLGGAAGTGKSRVIGAIRYLYGVMGKASGVVITATTGAAAVCLGASTIHTALGLMSKDLSAAPHAMKAKFAEVRLLIIDEISMFGEVLLRKLDQQLRNLKVHDVPFGGFSVLFVGDFCQFPPVVATSLMSPSVPSQSLWRQHVQAVVLLEEVKRAQGDSDFVRHLDSFRHGRVTLEAIAYFNQRVMQLDHSQGALAAAVTSMSNSPSSRAIPIVVAENADRVMINEAICLHLFQRYHSNRNHLTQSKAQGSQEADSPFFRIDASYFKTGEKQNNINVRGGQEIIDEKMRKALSTAKVNGLDHHLRLFVGMEVVVTENLCVGLGIANGSRAVVVRLQLVEHENPTPHRLDRHGFRQLSASADVAFVHLRLLLPSGLPCEGLLEDDLGPGEFRVSAKREYLDDLRSPGKMLHGIKQMYSMVQYPFVPAHCITAHKTQGLTLPRLIVGCSSMQPQDERTAGRNSKAGGNAPQRFLYVVLSRLRGLAGLTLLEPLPMDTTHSLYARKSTGKRSQAPDCARSQNAGEGASFPGPVWRCWRPIKGRTASAKCTGSACPRE